MILLPEELIQQARYKLLIHSVVPRPIAWVSSMDTEGNLNLAPFSFFTIGSTVPMTLIFCPQMGGRSGGKKDTLRNVEAVPEFVVNLTNEETVVPMNRSATELPPGASEFPWAGVTPAPSERIRVPRVAEAPIAFECVLQRVVMIHEGPGGGAAVFGEVRCIHVRDDLYQEGGIDLERFGPISRLGGNWYGRVTDTFELARIPPPEA